MAKCRYTNNGDTKVNYGADFLTGNVSASSYFMATSGENNNNNNNLISIIDLFNSDNHVYSNNIACVSSISNHNQFSYSLLFISILLIYLR